jgi:hypothetical protein
MALTGYERDSLDQYKVSELREIASTYYITFKTEFENTSTNYSRLNKEQLIYEITYDPDYQKANPDRKFNDTITKSDNRIIPIRRDLIGIERPGELMYRIVKALEDTKVNLPSPGNYYTYIYRAKTPGILFDLHPLIMASEPTGNGFFGFNYHWGKIRQYTFPEVQDGLYEMTVREFNTLRGVNYARFIQN